MFCCCPVSYGEDGEDGEEGDHQGAHQHQQSTLQLHTVYKYKHLSRGAQSYFLYFFKQKSCSDKKHIITNSNELFFRFSCK